MPEIHLIRDVLDDQLLDKKKRKIGKVDGIVVVLRKDKPPRVAYIEVGMSVVGHRIHTRLGRLVERVGRRWGVRQGEPYRIPWSKTGKIAMGIEMKVDLDAEETPLLDWEQWLNKNIIKRIPGGS
jgi:hypothetical protein